jgi:hypothetical protein
VDWHLKFGNNFHLTHKQLDAVAKGAGEWDTEYASVCNAALPFDRCAAHVGGEGWGKAVSFADLQVRVYDLAEAPAAVEERIKREGVADIERFSGRLPALEGETDGPWRRTRLSYEVFYGDYGGTAHVDFRVGRCGDRTFVFVFMYADYNPKQKTIKVILDSFTLK